MDGFNRDVSTQIELLEKIITSNKVLHGILKKANSLGIQHYYFGAGCITQTVWNFQMGFDLSYGISDIDFAYYDNSDLSFDAENTAIEHITNTLGPCPIKLDIKNQARVHLWYGEHFGSAIEPYASLEEAINTWPATATSIGVRLENDRMRLYAPFGLNDLFGMIVRPNKTKITEEIYLQKANKWLAKWPRLTVIPW